MTDTKQTPIRPMKLPCILGRFVRIIVAPITINVLVVGALATGSTLTWQGGLDLAVLGLLAHFFGFGLNAIVDLPIDRRNPRRQRIPLVSGELPLWAAHTLVWIQPLLALAWLNKPSLRDANPQLLVICTISLLLSIGYNLWSKRGPVPPIIAEWSLSGSIGLLLLAGASILAPTLNTLIWLLFAAACVLLHLVNSVPSGLKDLKTDLNTGARSFVIWVGARVLDEEGGDRIFIPAFLKVYAAVLQTVVVLLSVGIIWLVSAQYAAWQLALVTPLALLLHIAAAVHLRHILRTRTFTELRHAEPLLNALLNYAAVLTALLFRAPVYFGISVVLSLALALYRVLRARRSPLTLS